jgi:hypothetical protein
LSFSLSASYFFIFILLSSSYSYTNSLYFLSYTFYTSENSILNLSSYAYFNLSFIRYFSYFIPFSYDDIDDFCYVISLKLASNYDLYLFMLFSCCTLRSYSYFSNSLFTRSYNSSNSSCNFSYSFGSSLETYLLMLWIDYERLLRPNGFMPF